MSKIEDQLSKHPHWENLKKISQTLEDNGFQSVLVGGGVRDSLLGLPVKDFDLATSAKPDEIAKIFPRAKTVWSQYAVTLVPYGDTKDHIEVTSFRKESKYEDGRRPKEVEYCSIEEDAKRRDLTINALFYDIQKKEIVDFVEGQKDLKNKIIRTVGEPKTRFLEDHLRLLRALRFSHQFEFPIEEKTKAAIKEIVPYLEKISQERKTDELLKMFSKGDFSKALKILDEYKTLDILFLLPNQKPKNPYDFWKQKFSFLKNQSYLWTTIGLPYFFDDSDDNSEDGFQAFLKGLKISSNDFKKCLFYFRSLKVLFSKDNSFIKKVTTLSEDANPLKEMASLWENYQKQTSLKDFFKEYDNLKSLHGGKWPKALITGEDLLKETYQKEQFGSLLTQAYEYQLETPKATKKDVLDYLKSLS